MSKITAAYFYSMNRNAFAYVIVYGELAAVIVLVLTLPQSLGIDGVWLALPLAQVIIAFIALAMLAGLYFRGKKYPDFPEYVRISRD